MFNVARNPVTNRHMRWIRSQVWPVNTVTVV